ncbi:hypothetical protein RR48_02837 [Papilio machaon]|uniref:Uncharacterized protein n=1 Tax=Papilio machaon TaxID=76193 RepID=A0A0N1PJP1_PAPMA|nr:hypothetical protein RR48_02837 [Papilio machaon]
MLSSNDIERLIAEKRHDIEREKIDLGLSRSLDNNVEESKENNSSKKVQISKKVSENNYVKPDDRLLKEGNSLEEDIPADLERYIRVMKTHDMNEFSVIDNNFDKTADHLCNETHFPSPVPPALPCYLGAPLSAAP